MEIELNGSRVIISIGVSLFGAISFFFNLTKIKGSKSDGKSKLRLEVF